MAQLKKAKGRESGSGYARVFGDNELGTLISRVQSTVISSGTELENIIKKKVNLIPNLDEFLKQEIMKDGVQVADKRKVKKCDKLDFSGSEPDFLIFKRRNGKQECHLVELKDGDSFDTKKAEAERHAMHSFISKNAKDLQYTVQSHFCCFNQDSKKAIFEGYKRKIALEEAMTGIEFCELLEIDYDEIVEARKKDGLANKLEFLKELVRIESVRKVLLKLLKI